MWGCSQRRAAMPIRPPTRPRFFSTWMRWPARAWESSYFQNWCPANVVGSREATRPTAAARGSKFVTRAAPPATIASPLALTTVSGCGMPKFSASATRPPGSEKASYPSQMNGTPMAAWPAHFTNDITTPESTRRHNRMREPSGFRRPRAASILRPSAADKPAGTSPRAMRASQRELARARPGEPLFSHGGSAHHQLARFGVHALGAVAVDRLEDGPGGTAAQGLEVHVHAGQLRAGTGGQDLPVVEAGHRHVLRHRTAQITQAIEHP